MQLRSPAFGNTHSLETHQVIKHNLSGELMIAYDHAWPFVEAFRWEFRALKTLEKTQLLQFLIENAGSEITIVDFENLSWRGIFRSPIEVVDMHGDGCSWVVILEFEGQIA